MGMRTVKTRYQALFVAWLRLRKECSWRAVAAHWYNRYEVDGSFKPWGDRVVFEFLTVGGNQIDGMMICREASEILGIEVD